jgi:hypothetical protein
MSPIVRIADPRGSTPRPLSLFAVALGCTALGLLLLKLSLVAPRPEAGALEPVAGEESAGASDERPDEAPVADDPEPGPDELAIAGAVDLGVGPALADGDAVAADAEVAVEAPLPAEGGDADPVAQPGTSGDTPGAERTLEHGRVAYFQCPNDSCPRDHGLERSVWRTLDRLGACLGAAGEADVRVSVAAGAVTDVRFRERGAAGIDLGVLNRCVSPPLMRVTGSTLPDGAVVSFRFQVR